MAEQPDRSHREPERDERTGKSAAAQRMQRKNEWVDHQLRLAMERGEFDNLPGAGKPIKDLGAQHDPDWWIKRLVEREKITGVLPPALQLRKDDAELDASARPAHRRVRGTPRARGVQRPGDEGAVHPGRRPAVDHDAARRRRRGRVTGGRGCRSVGRPPAGSPPHDPRPRPPSPRASVALVRARVPERPQTRSGSTSGTRCEVCVAPHSSLLIEVQERAEPFLRAGTVRQKATPDPDGTKAR